jgi:glutaredoxin-dependent peroxiredoxin
MPLEVGTLAPTFTLKSKKADGLVDVTIPAAGKATVLLFFPLAFTSVCTDEMCSVTQGLGSFAGAEVIAVSVDSPFAQEAWAKANAITITLASDLNKEVATAYGVLFKGIAGIGDSAARAAFVIDAAGQIVYAEQTPTPKDLPNFDAVKAKLAEL